MPHISLAAEKIFSIGTFGITNSFFTTYIVLALMFVGSFFLTRKLTIIPSASQQLAEIIVGGLYDFFRTVCGEYTRTFFPLLASLFLFIILSNWTGLLPGVGTIGLTHKQTTAPEVSLSNAVDAPTEKSETKQALSENNVHSGNAESGEFLPLFRAPTADLNTTVALAIVSVVAIQYFGFKYSGVHYSTRFLNFTSPIMFFVGILEIVSEVSKIISFSFRLFGNIFAGEVLLVVISSLIQYPLLLPLPFYGLELFVGFIQALVFSMLTAVFLNIAIAHSSESHREEVSVHE